MTSLDTWRDAEKDASFEETLRALEDVVSYLEEGGLTLDDAVSAYEIGSALSRRCERLLSEAELRISRIDESLDSVGTPLSAINIGPTLAPVDEPV